MLSATSALFDPYSDAFCQRPYDIYQRLRDEAPVYYNAERGFWALSRYDDVAPAMKNAALYSSAHGITLDMVQSALRSPDDETAAARPGGPMIIMMDPPDHSRMRKLVSKVFTPRAIAGLEPTVRGIVAKHLSRIDLRSFNAVREFSDLFPIDVITTMLGVPEDDRDQMREWLAAPLERVPGRTGMSTEAMEAVRSAGRMYHRIIAERRASPQDDMITRLTQVEVEREGGGTTGLTDLEIAGFVGLLGGAGAETVAKVIGTAMVLFAEHPDQWQALRADRSKIPAAFEELLRFEGPVQYDVRVTTDEVHLHGTTIPARSPVLMLLASATRDERRFDEAGTFDIARPLPGHNLGFGYGIHSCLGAALARMEGRIALDMLADALPHFEVERDLLVRAQSTSVAGWASVPVRS